MTNRIEREQGRRLLTMSACRVTLILLTAAAIISPKSSKAEATHSVPKSTNFFKTTTAGSSSGLFRASVISAEAGVAAARVALIARSVLGSRAAAVPGGPMPLDDCLELLDITGEQLGDVAGAAGRSAHDERTWLSAALTNTVTCADGLGKANQATVAELDELSRRISGALALQVAEAGEGRRLHSDGFPGWLTASDRKLLEASPTDIRPHAVVASDGSGTHGSINLAIAFVSLNPGGGGDGGRSVIYVKAGTYRENIKIATKQKNVMLMGDGKGKTVIIGSRNAEDGSSTYQSATVAAMGAGFIAKGVSIINDSGPNKHQAVALRVGGDHSVIYQCSIQGYQDTLYAYANRQFYRDCDISGTVDFIFGNSAAVFQNCLIQPLRPAAGQKNSITAQGRTDPNQNTGISIQSSRIVGSTGGAPTYLGRPWKQYARVVFMESEIDGSVSPAGWEPWAGSFALKTLYYGEYKNTGPGAGTSGRVRWPGVRPAMSDSEASQFTVGNFISGASWISATGAPYSTGL